MPIDKPIKPELTEKEAFVLEAVQQIATPASIAAIEAKVAENGHTFFGQQVRSTVMDLLGKEKIAVVAV